MFCIALLPQGTQSSTSYRIVPFDCGRFINQLYILTSTVICCVHFVILTRNFGVPYILANKGVHYHYHYLKQPAKLKAQGNQSGTFQCIRFLYLCAHYASETASGYVWALLSTVNNCGLMLLMIIIQVGPSVTSSTHLRIIHSCRSRLHQVLLDYPSCTIHGHIR